MYADVVVLVVLPVVVAVAAVVVCVCVALTLVAVVMHGNVVEQVEVPSVAIADDDFVPCASGHFIIQSGTTVDAKLPCWDVVTGMSATIRNGDLLVAVNGMNSDPSQTHVVSPLR